MTPDTVTVAPMSVSMSEKPLSLAIVEDLAIAIHRDEDGFQAVRDSDVRGRRRRCLRDLREGIDAVIPVRRTVRPEFEQTQRRVRVAHEAAVLQPQNWPVIRRRGVEALVMD